MKKLSVILLGLLIGITTMKAFDYDVTYTTGAFGGTAFWNAESLTGEDAVQVGDEYIRFYNNLRFKSELFDNFKVKFNGLRSDNLSADNNANETKLYELYAKYDFKEGFVKAGRFAEFNRWTMGSIDGFAFRYDFLHHFDIAGYTGFDVKYGDVDYGVYKIESYDDLEAHVDLGYHQENISAKAKYFHNHEADLTGLDLFTKFGNTGITANLSYNLTESDIHDAGLGLSGNAFNGKLKYFANYNLLKPRMWNGYFTPESYQRIQGGLTHTIPWNMSVTGMYMATLTEEVQNHLFNVAFNHKYFTFGFNYMTNGDYYNRFGITLGGNYSPMNNMWLTLGVGTVNYDYTVENYYTDYHQMLMAETYEYQLLSITSYLRLKYKFFDDFMLNLYANYYHNGITLTGYSEDDPNFDDPFANLRGGITLQYHLGGGK